MAIDIKEILADGLIDLIEQKSLSRITIKDIINYTNVSRQSFYNHFQDKNDLIQYIYLSKIIPDYTKNNFEIDFYHSLLNSFKRMKKYHKFMKQACLMEDKNCLKDFIYEHCQEFDLKWHQEIYGKEPLPDTIKFATQYHANASSSMTLSWILSDMPVSCQEITRLITQLRGLGMDSLYNDWDKINPYHITNNE